MARGWGPLPYCDNHSAWIECLLYVKHYAKCIICIISFNPPNSLKWSLLSCWKMSLRGWNCQLTLEQDWGNRRLLTPPVLEMYIPPILLALGASSRMWLWESRTLLRPSDGIHHWTPLRPLYKLLRFWRAGAEILWRPRQASYVSSLVVKPATYQSGVAVSFFGLFLPSEYGASFRFQLASSQGFKPTYPHFIDETANLQNGSAIFPGWQSNKVLELVWIHVTWFQNSHS